MDGKPGGAPVHDVELVAGAVARGAAGPAVFRPREEPDAGDAVSAAVRTERIRAPGAGYTMNARHSLRTTLDARHSYTG